MVLLYTWALQAAQAAGASWVHNAVQASQVHNVGAARVHSVA